MLVGIGQCRALDGTTEAAVIELATLRLQTYFDVAQALAVSKLGKGHGQELVPTRESSHALVAVVTGDAAIEFVVGKKTDELRKHGSSLVHKLSPSKLISKE